MTTVIAAYTANGCISRCDANCHEARTKKCKCICGGRNHGAGLHAAQQNTGRWLVGLNALDLKDFAEARKLDPKDLTVINRLEIPNSRQARRQAHDRITQPDLFDQ